MPPDPVVGQRDGGGDIGRSERLNPSGGFVGPRRQATCECCRRNDAPKGKRVCVSCANHNEEWRGWVTEALNLPGAPHGETRTALLNALIGASRPRER